VSENDAQVLKASATTAPTTRLIFIGSQIVDANRAGYVSHLRSVPMLTDNWTMWANQGREFAMIPKRGTPQAVEDERAVKRAKYDRFFGPILRGIVLIVAVCAFIALLSFLLFGGGVSGIVASHAGLLHRLLRPDMDGP
jgi:hypothetical protein